VIRSLRCFYEGYRGDVANFLFYRFFVSFSSFSALLPSCSYSREIYTMHDLFWGEDIQGIILNLWMVRWITKITGA
jgi:hypothetical protein